MGGIGMKVLISAFLVWLSSQMGAFATDVLGKVRVSVQASEMMTMDGYITVAAIEERRTQFPRNQTAFERTIRDQLTSRGRDPTIDRWGESFLYEPRGTRGYRLTCKGPDKLLGSEDDIVVERDLDRVQINRDPVKIMEEAIERKQKLDTEAAQRLRDLLVTLGAAQPAGSETPLDKLDPKVQAELRSVERELSRMLAGD